MTKPTTTRRSVGRPSKKAALQGVLQVKQKKLGRRTAEEQAPGGTQALILNGAEQIFSERGYLGTSLQEVAGRANVTTALITYYFKTKQNLFTEVYRRRADILTHRRLELLEQLKLRNSPPTLSEIVRAYLIPQFEMRRLSEGGRNFARLQARLASEPEEIVRPLRKKIYDQTLRAFATEMEAAAGKHFAHQIGWAVTFMIGIILYMLRDIDRLGEFSDNRFHVGSDDEIIEKIVEFVVTGIGAGQHEKPKTK